MNLFKAGILALTFILFSLSLCAQHILVPGKGIQGDSISINQTTIEQVIGRYGNAFEETAERDVVIYRYPSLGLSFTTDAYEQYPIVRRISFTYPFKVQTNNGVILNKTTWDEMELIYGSEGGFTWGDVVYKPFPGIAYYIHKDPKQKGWNGHDTIYKIEITDEKTDEAYRRVNYSYNVNKEIESVAHLSIFISEKRSLSQLLDYLKHPQNSFAPKLERETRKPLESTVEWVQLEVEIGRSDYFINLLSSGDSLVYAQGRVNFSWFAQKSFRGSSEDSVVFDFRNGKLLERIINMHNDFYQTDIDTFYESSFIAHQFVYGIGCGFAGMPPPERQRLELMIEEKDYTVISYWLKSMNPEIQAYGLEGVYRLSKMGIKPSENDVRVMKHLISKPLKLHACSGCIYGIEKYYQDIVSPGMLRRLKRKWNYN